MWKISYLISIVLNPLFYILYPLPLFFYYLSYTLIIPILPPPSISLYTIHFQPSKPFLHSTLATIHLAHSNVIQLKLPHINTYFNAHKKRKLWSLHNFLFLLGYHNLYPIYSLIIYKRVYKKDCK